MSMVDEVYDVSVLYEVYEGVGGVSMVYDLCMRWPWCMRCIIMYDVYKVSILYEVCEWCMKCP